MEQQAQQHKILARQLGNINVINVPHNWFHYFIILMRIVYSGWAKHWNMIEITMLFIGSIIYGAALVTTLIFQFRRHCQIFDVPRYQRVYTYNRQYYNDKKYLNGHFMARRKARTRPAITNTQKSDATL